MNYAQVPPWAAVTAAVLLFLAGAIALTGSIGLLRMGSFKQRMHPPAMGATLGTGCVLIASMVLASALRHRPVIHELLLTLFIVLSSPVSAMTLMRAGVYRSRR